MNKLKILHLIEDRKNFPVGGSRFSEKDYIDIKLKENKGIFGLIVHSLFLSSFKDRFIRNNLLDETSIRAIIDLGEIWSPFTNIRFTLLVCSKKVSNIIFVSKYKIGKAFTPKPKSFKNTGVIEPQEVTKDYLEYINKVEEIIGRETTEKVENEKYKIWTIKRSEINSDNLQQNYYDPDLRDAFNKLKKEKTAVLSDLSDIKHVKREKGALKGLILKTKDFIYPLNYHKLKEDTITSEQIRKGDILFSSSFSGENKFYLVSEEPKKKIYASSFLTVIRVKSKQINPEYLFLYLQSETVKKYILMYQRGSVFPRISNKDISELPVIIPAKITVEKSKKLFQTLFLKEEIDIISEINKQLFDRKKPLKPIQKEFILEELEELRKHKLILIQKIFEDDLNELKLCINNKLYKSFLILSGSILEAFLLDWISEIENKNYFISKEDNYTLGKLIWDKLKRTHKDMFGEDIIKKADDIRKKRNFVHPKEYFQSGGNIDDKLCRGIIRDLKFIFNKR